jgi:DNA mismatch repair protein MutL
MSIKIVINPRPIRQLPAGVVNKIAAGEVIERPSSVVKELLENSVDAGADRIEVAIENGGLDSIRVTDNGSGIPHDELQLAVTSHATSKIENAEDLFRVGTFGFRGEALASIAEVSEFTLRSRTVDQDSGYELIVRGGHSESIEPVGSPIGTTIKVENLFYNTPVRRKFMRTPQTESGHVAEAFTRVALANSHCHLTLLHNGKSNYDLAPCGDWQSRIHDFFGPEIGDALIPIQSQDGGVSLSGYVVDPSVSRSHNRMQYLFLNGRYIRDRSLQHALSEAYRGLLMTGRYPICFLKMDMPFDLVDVNVHPAKLEVRFQDGGRIYSQLLSTLRNRFLTTDLTARAQLSQLPPITGGATDPLPYPNPTSSSSPFELKSHLPSHQHQIAFPAATSRNWVDAPFQRSGSTPTSIQTFVDPLSTSPHAPHGNTGHFVPEAIKHESNQAAGQQVEVASTLHHTEFAGSRSRTLALQVHDMYLITETDEGMIVIDQHALHERVLYEQLRSKIFSGSLETQQLLVPEPITLPPHEAATVLENAELLKKIGIVVAPFGGDTVVVMAYPAMLANHNPAEMLRSLIDSLMTEGSQPDSQDLLDELLHMIACKAAIKAGDRLSRDEITALLEFRGLCQDSHHCPHGRPTALVFSREELDRRFKRI